MKTFIRYGLLAGLGMGVIAWVMLIWVGLGSGSIAGILGNSSVATAADGSNITISTIDKLKFSRVTTYLSIKNKAGDVLSGLRREDFSLREDNLPANILEFIGAGDQPLTAVLVIDQSGSMSQENKMQGAIDAATAFLDNVQPDRDSVGVIAFSGYQNELSPLKRLSASDITTLKQKIRALRAEGGTEFYNSVRIAANKLRGTSGRRTIIAMTDGIDNSQSSGTWFWRTQDLTIDPQEYKDMLQALKENDVTVYAIALGSELDERHMKTLAKETKGEFYHAPNANQLTDLYRKLIKGLQNEYSLTYESPTPRQDGTQRKIEITTRLPAGTVSATGSYVVAGLISQNTSSPLLFVLLPLLLAMLTLPMLMATMRRMIQGTHSPELEPTGVIGSPSPPTMAMACPKCRTPYRLGAKFCGKCGARI